MIAIEDLNTKASDANAPIAITQVSQMASPFAKFRAQKKVLSVSDIVSPSW